jgi:hypothetical protein
VVQGDKEERTGESPMLTVKGSRIKLQNRN